MPMTTITVSCSIQRSPRVQQVEGLFDLVPARKTELSWEVSLPLDERPWHVGLTVGPPVGQIGAHAMAKTVRQRGQKFIAVTCHEDVQAWLNPDWVYRPDANAFTWRFLQRRPAIELQICRVERTAWQIFKHHHYL